MAHAQSPTISAAVLDSAVSVLRAGGVVAFPTETVYGLGADAANAEAVAKIFLLKGRPSTHPLIVHLASAAQAPSWCREFPPEAQALADAFWPGPLTLILNRAPAVLNAVTGGQNTVGLRVPRHPVALALLKAFGGGIAAPSANKFGRVSPTTAAHVQSEFAGSAGPEMILDGGACAVGVESTIVDLSGLPARPPVILRPGGVTREQIAAVLGHPVALHGEAPVPASAANAPAIPRAPGLLESHYAPLADVFPVPVAGLAARVAALQKEGISFVVLARRSDIDGAEACSAGPNSAALSPAPAVAACGATLPCNTLFQALPEDDEGYARRLYQYLRDADQQGFEAIVIVPPAAAGLGLAIVDRLNRAAGPTPPKQG